MNEGSVFKSRVNKYLDRVAFTLPNVKKGSVIECSYTVDADVLTPWQIQHSIPVQWSEYTMEVPEQYAYRKQFKGTLKPTTHTRERVREKWVFANVPAFNEEPLMPMSPNFLSKDYPTHSQIRCV